MEYKYPQIYDKQTEHHRIYAIDAKLFIQTVTYIDHVSVLLSHVYDDNFLILLYGLQRF